jgi:hypothetical protein
MVQNKKGSHVGMILSFVLFITFIVFLYTVVNPSIKNTESKRDLLNEIGARIIDNASSDFSIISIIINESDNPSTSCVQLNEFLFSSGIGISEFSEEGNISARVLVKNENYQMQDTYYDSGANLSIAINRTENSNLFFKIYHSPGFDPSEKGSISPCTPLEIDEDYSIGSVNSGPYVFEEKIYLLIEEYNSNYTKLKNNLKISPGNEFSFEFELSNGTKLSVEEKIPTENIYAEEIPIQYFNENATIFSGFINVKVW